MLQCIYIYNFIFCLFFFLMVTYYQILVRKDTLFTVYIWNWLVTSTDETEQLLNPVILSKATILILQESYQLLR